MNYLKLILSLSIISIIILLMGGCTTDPIIPAGGIPSTEGPTVQDPGAENPCADGEISFQHQVLPLMVSSCAYSGCHDAITAEDDVILDTYENVLQQVTPGDPNDSDLYESIVETDLDDIMPPPPANALLSSQIDIIRDWILQGANNTDCGLPCDSTASSFATDVFPLLQDYCIGCHNSNRSDGNVDIETYSKIIPYIESGDLIGTINHSEFYSKMPPSGSKLSECRIAQIQKWIDEGAQNN